MKRYRSWGLMLLVLAGAGFLTACSDEEDPTGPDTEMPTAADRAKFIGNWAGTYSCGGGVTIPDTLLIAAGAGDLGLAVTIHAGADNPDQVTGELVEPDVVEIAGQNLGGAPGSATITYLGTDLLAYSQSGLGITCGGQDYAPY